jgi:hypothetical protein
MKKTLTVLLILASFVAKSQVGGVLPPLQQSPSAIINLLGKDTGTHYTYRFGFLAIDTTSVHAIQRTGRPVILVYDTIGPNIKVVDVIGNLLSGNNKFTGLDSISPFIAVGASSSNQGLLVQPAFSMALNSSANGLRDNPSYVATVNVSSITGFNIDMSNQITGTTGIYAGGSFTGRFNSSGNTSTGFGFKAAWTGNNTGGCTNCYGLWIGSPSMTSSSYITNNTGILIDPQKTSGVGNAYAIRAPGRDTTQWGGPMEIGPGMITLRKNSELIINDTTGHKGILIPRHTTAEIAAITTPIANGLLMINTDSMARGGFMYYDSVANTWRNVGDRNGGGSGGAVNSVANSDGTLTISPTTGTVVASLALGHANTWTGKQTQPAPIFTGTTSAGANDSVATIDPATGQVHWRSGTFNLNFSNGLNAPTGDSVYWGGTLIQNTNIAGSGFQLDLGTSGSHLARLESYADTIALRGSVGFGWTTATDANYTAANEGVLYTLPLITANRTITLQTPPLAARIMVFSNRNTSTSFSWSFSTTVINPDASTLSTLLNGYTYVLQYNPGISGWIVISRTSSSLNGIVASADLTAQTTASTITSYAAPGSGSFNTYRVGGYLTVTAVSLDVIQLQVSYTDETSTSRTQSFFVQGATTGISATGANGYSPMDIRVKQGTTITVSTVLTTGTGSITYDAGSSITQLY